MPRRVSPPFVAAIGVVALAAFVRLAVLQSNVGRLDGDEAATGVMAQRILDGDFFVYFAGQTYGGALEQYPQALVLALAPDTPTMLRLVQVALSVATCALTYLLGRRILRSHWQAVFAAALFAVGPYFNVFWGIKSRGGYVSGQLLAVLILLLALRLDVYRRRPLLVAFAFGLCVGLALWQSLLTLYVVIPAALWAIGSARSRLAELVPVGVGGAILGAAPAITSQLVNGFSLLGGEQPPTTFAQRFDLLLDPVLPMWLGVRDIGGAVSVEHLAPGVIVFGALLALGAAAWQRRRGLAGLLRPDGHRRPCDLVLAVLLVAPFLYAASSYAWFSGEPRYLFTLYPVLCIALAALVPRGTRWTIPVAVVIAALVALPSATTVQRVHDAGGGGGPVTQGGGVVRSEDLPEVVDLLVAQGVRSVYADYWLAYPLQFSAGDRLRVAPYANSRFPEITAAVSNDPKAAFAAPVGPGADQLAGALAAQGITAGRREIDGIVLFERLSKPATPASLGVVPG